MWSQKASGTRLVELAGLGQRGTDAHLGHKEKLNERMRETEKETLEEAWMAKFPMWPRNRATQPSGVGGKPESVHELPCHADFSSTCVLLYGTWEKCWLSSWSPELVLC